MPTLKDAMVRAGVSYRQADHWKRAGYIRATSEGSGTVATLHDTELRVLCRMAALVRAGFHVEVAAKVARTTVEQGVRAADLPGGVRVILEVAS